MSVLSVSVAVILIGVIIFVSLRYTKHSTTTIHSINKWSFIVTLVLYVTVIFGALAQIVLGLIQSIMAIYLTIQQDTLSLKTRQHLYRYWCGFITYFIGIALYYWVPDVESIVNAAAMGGSNNYLILAYFTVVPMGIASYFVYITSLLDNRIDTNDSKDTSEVMDP